jgi:PASTA domain
VSSTSTAPSQASQRVGRGGPAGRQLVGEYVGEPAGQAAQAVRRAGLRPGLDRSFGCAPELAGRVVSQEPPAGDELPRNGLVTLYVAAPGAAPNDEPAAPAASLAPTAVENIAAQPRAHRGRKRGLARSAPRAVPPPPSAPPPESHRVERTDTPADAITDELGLHGDLADADVGEPATELEEAADYGALDGEQFVIHAEDVFAGRAEPAWRRVYPRRGETRPSVDRLRSRFADCSPLVKAAAMLAAVWIVVALAVAFAGSSTHRHPASSVAALAQRRSAGEQPAPLRARALPSRPPDHMPSPTERQVRHLSAPRRRARPIVPSTIAATAARVSAQPAVPAPPAPATTRPIPTQPPPASAPAAPAQPQTPGGLFSP